MAFSPVLSSSHLLRFSSSVIALAAVSFPLYAQEEPLPLAAALGVDAGAPEEIESSEMPETGTEAAEIESLFDDIKKLDESESVPLEFPDDTIDDSFSGSADAVLPLEAGDMPAPSMPRMEDDLPLLPDMPDMDMPDFPEEPGFPEEEEAIEVLPVLVEGDDLALPVLDLPAPEEGNPEDELEALFDTPGDISANISDLPPPPPPSAASTSEDTDIILPPIPLPSAAEDKPDMPPVATKPEKKPEKQPEKKAAKAKGPGAVPESAKSAPPSFKTKVLSDKIYKKDYDKENRHLPKAWDYSDYRRLFFVAVERGDINAVRAFLDQHIDRNMRDEQGDTALMVAVRSGQLPMIELLLGRGLDPNGVDNLGMAPLHVAALTNRPDIITQLAVRRAKVDMTDSQDRTALIYAVNRGHTPAVKALLEAGADVNRVAEEQKQPLHIAAARGNVAIVRLLLQHGADSNAPDGMGRTPAHYAGYFNQQEAMQAIQAAGGSTHMPDYSGLTPSAIAGQAGQVPTVPQFNYYQDPLVVPSAQPAPAMQMPQGGGHMPTPLVRQQVVPPQAPSQQPPMQQQGGAQPVPMMPPGQGEPMGQGGDAYQDYLRRMQQNGRNPRPL